MFLREVLPHRLVALPQVSVKGWPTFNPSICASDEGWLVVLRTANYVLPAYWPDSQPETGVDGIYLLGSDRKHAVTENWLLRLTPGWNEIDRVLLTDAGQFESRAVMEGGIEDIRLVRRGNEWWGMGTCASFQARQRNVIGVCRIFEDGFLGQVQVVHSPEGVDQEKNWMPVVKDDKLLALYSAYPWKVVEIGDFGAEEVVFDGFQESLGEFWSGGSQLVPYEGGYLGVLHKKRRAGGGFVYEHRLALADSDLKPVQFGKPWAFAHEGVEFCAGLALQDDVAAFSFAIGDCQPFVMEVKQKDLAGLLEEG
jgi:hypothetical protein